jgi:hypothetical protein
VTAVAAATGQPGEAAAKASPPAPDKQRRINEALQNPLVQKALKILDGQILDVKDQG